MSEPTGFPFGRPPLGDIPSSLAWVRRALSAGDLGSAKTTCAALLSHHPKLPEAEYLMAVIEARTGKPDSAIEHMRRVIQLDPTAFEAVEWLANLLRNQGQIDESIKFSMEMLRMKPDHPSGNISLGLALLVLGRFEESRSAFYKAIELAPWVVDPYCQLIGSKVVSEEDAALVDRIRIMAAEPGRGEDQISKLRYALGKVHNDLEQYETAMAEYDEANHLALQVQYKGKRFDGVRHSRRADRLIETFTQDYFRSHSHFGARSELPIFIVGMIRSGTTLVEQIISSHHKVAAGGELDFWIAPQRNAIVDRLTEGGWNAETLNATIAAYEDLLAGFVSDETRVTDKMPINFSHLGPIHALFPSARIIHCRRNPVDTCLSIWMTPYGRGAEFCYDKRSIVTAYRLYMRFMEHWRRVLPAEVFFEIDYEQLIADPERVTKQMIAFCGLEWDPACLRHEKNTRAISTPSVWQARQPVYASSVERWRKYEPWLGEFLELAGDF